MKFRLVVTMGADRETVLSEHVFSKDSITIGRTSDNDVMLPDVETRVSARHARIDRKEGAFQLADLGSTNGTLLNGRRVEAEGGAPLKEGDLVEVGPYSLRFFTSPPSQSGAGSAEELPQAALGALREVSARFVGDDRFESAEEIRRFGELVGQTLDLLLEWLSRSLKGRAEFETSLSADLTRILSLEGNPVKKSGGKEEMGRFLLDWRGQRPLPPIRKALDDTFKDLTLHQLGLLAGLQEVVHAVLRRLAPQVVEGEAMERAGGGLARLFLKTSLAKRAWERYKRNYDSVFMENSRLFNEVIYPSLKKGYIDLHAKAAGGEGEAGPDASPPGLNLPRA